LMKPIRGGPREAGPLTTDALPVKRFRGFAER